MSEQRLFDVAKIGCYLDTYAPGIEKRRGEEVSVITLKMRIQPFDSKLAASLDKGVGGDCNIRATVFTLNSSEPKPNFTRHDFKLGLARQNLELFSTPDTNASRISLNQARITGTYVRTEKDNNALAFVFKATLGPVGRDELELIHSLHRRQTFVTFHEGEPILDAEDDEEDDVDSENEDAVELRPAPMFDDPRDEKPESQTSREIGSRHKLHSHQSRKKAAAKPKAKPSKSKRASR